MLNCFCKLVNVFFHFLDRSWRRNGHCDSTTLARKGEYLVSDFENQHGAKSYWEWMLHWILHWCCYGQTQYSGNFWACENLAPFHIFLFHILPFSCRILPNIVAIYMPLLSTYLYAQMSLIVFFLQKIFTQ